MIFCVGSRQAPERGPYAYCGEDSLITGAKRGTGEALVKEDRNRRAKRVFAGTRSTLPDTDPRLKARINVVIDYLWGETANAIIAAAAKTVEDGVPVRFVNVGGASRVENIELPSVALRSSASQLIGSGVKNVPFLKLLGSIRNVLEAVVPVKPQIATKTVPLSAIEETWDAPGHHALFSPFRKSKWEHGFNKS